MSRSRPRSCPLRLELLEDRAVPATWGNAWPYGHNLSLSFAPDGTQIGGHQSELFRVLDAQYHGDTQAWQTDILRAFQTWAANANLNIRVVPDDGSPFSGSGTAQPNGHFGEIRIAAYPMSPEVLAFALPYEATAGSSAGDVFINSSDVFGSEVAAGQVSLFSLMLHESGHVFGMGDERSDPQSPLYEDYNAVTTLDQADIQRIQAIFGVRQQDHFESGAGDETPATATQIALADTTSSGIAGAPPAVDAGAPSAGVAGDPAAIGAGAPAAGVAADPVSSPLSPGSPDQKSTGSPTLTKMPLDADISTASDTDWYRFEPPSNADTVTIQVKTSDISLLEPRLSVYDATGKLIDTVFSSSPLSGDLAITLRNLDPSADYYVAVSAATSDVFGIGGYQLQIDPHAASPRSSGLQTPGGPQTAPQRNSSNVDDRTNHRFDIAVDLGPGNSTSTGYSAAVSVSEAGGVNTYQFMTPNLAPNTGNVMTVTVQRDGGLPGTAIQVLTPNVQVYDAAGAPVEAEVLVNDSGTLSLQIANPRANATYYVRVQAAPGGSDSAGDYTLGVVFDARPVVMSTLAEGFLDGSTPQETHTFQVPISQIVHLVLSGENRDNPNPASVELQIYDQSGDALLILAASDGQPHSATVYLPAGTYTILVATATPTDAGHLPGGGIAEGGAAIAQVSYRVRVQVLTDRQGPHVEDTTAHPVAFAPAISQAGAPSPRRRSTEVAFLSVQVAYSDPHLETGHERPHQTALLTQQEQPTPSPEIAAIASSPAPSGERGAALMEAPRPREGGRTPMYSAPGIVATYLTHEPLGRAGSDTLEPSSVVSDQESQAPEISVVDRCSFGAINPASLSNRAKLSPETSVTQVIDTELPVTSPPAAEIQANQHSQAEQEAAQASYSIPLGGSQTYVQLPLCVLLCYYLWAYGPSVRVTSSPRLGASR
jgi:hypothetical protein